MPKQIVVITDREDVHVPFVQRHLDVPFTIIDPQALLEGMELSFEMEEDTLVVTYDGVRLDAVSGVWYRKPRDVMEKDLHVDPRLKTYSQSALQNHTIMVLSAFRDAVWASNYFAIRQANSKAWQIEAAKRIGMQTPRTLMTSDAARAKAFIEAEGSCIVKAQSAYSPTFQGTRESFFTTKISTQNMPDLSNLHLAPSIFQQGIDTEFDVRVTVVGDKVFPAIIRANGFDDDSAIRDWRLGHYEGELRIEPYENFPADVARMCVEHNKALGLKYGAIDFVMDKHNQLWFLENNPNGQWGFVERQTDLPIGKALAQLLAGE